MNWREKASVGLLRTHELVDHRAREYTNRLAVWRRDGERLGWEELQAVKQTIWGDRVAVEVFPAESDVVNLRHTRHLWWSPKLETAVRAECQHPEFR